MTESAVGGCICILELTNEISRRRVCHAEERGTSEACDVNRVADCEVSRLPFIY